MMIHTHTIYRCYRDLRARALISKADCPLSDTRSLALAIVGGLGTSGELVQLARADEQKLYQRAIQLALEAGWVRSR
jgi:hypothetical protein